MHRVAIRAGKLQPKVEQQVEHEQRQHREDEGRDVADHGPPRGLYTVAPAWVRRVERQHREERHLPHDPEDCEGGGR